MISFRTIIIHSIYYTPLIQSLIQHHNTNYHMYADDTQLYLYISSEPSKVSALVYDLEKCISDV